jgi:hypothetical protein
MASSGASGSGEAFATAMAAAWENAADDTSGYCRTEDPTFPVTNGGLCGGPSSNIGWQFEFFFLESEATTLNFEFGTDFGNGAAVYIDDVFSFSS